jgi:hypothetical protein
LKQIKIDFILKMDKLREDGKIMISPISREANSFLCPKCGNLISPENADSYTELAYGETKGAAIQCRQCKARIELIWETDLSNSICEQYRKTK